MVLLAPGHGIRLWMTSVPPESRISANHSALVHLSCVLAAVSLLQPQTICEKYLGVPLAGQAG